MSNFQNYDLMYRKSISSLTVEERVSYCESYVDRATQILVISGKHMDSRQKKAIEEMLQAAREEITQLRRQNQNQEPG